MISRRAVAFCVLSAIGLTGCGSTSVDSADGALEDPPSTAPTTARPDSGVPARSDSEVPALPNGWRWESYRDVQVAVPGDWGWINGSQRISQWCITGADPVTGIGRPGASTLVGCGHDGGASPGTTIAKNGRFVAFQDADFVEEGDAGDRRTRIVGDIAVSAQADPELREQILATAHRITIDANGCPVEDVVTRTPSTRPSPAIELGQLQGVESVAVCRYSLDEGDRTIEGPSLLSSIRLTNGVAARSLNDLATAPAAGGQDRPQGCAYKYGAEMIVLLVESAAGSSRVHIRYSGCDHNAVDDGVSPRRLTPALQPFFTGGNRADGISGGAGKAEAILGVRNGKVPPPSAPPTR